MGDFIFKGSTPWKGTAFGGGVFQKNPKMGAATPMPHHYGKPCILVLKSFNLSHLNKININMNLDAQI